MLDRAISIILFPCLTLSDYFSFQIQSGALVDPWKSCPRTSEEQHIRSGSQFGSAEIISVQSAYSEFGGDALDLAESTHQFPTHRFHTVQVPVVAGSNGGRNSDWHHLLSRHSREMWFPIVLGENPDHTRVSGEYKRLLRFDSKVCVPCRGHYLPDHFSRVFGTFAGRHWR